MELIRGLHNLRPRHRGCAATIGNFDGVHLGHQAVLGQLSERAAELGLPMVVVTFEPQPQEFFSPATAPPRLTRLREKLEALRRYAVERVLVLRFDARLAALSADEFIQRVLVDGLDVRYLVVGDDFRFGQGRAGDFRLLQETGAREGFQVVNMHTFAVGGERVSSTRVRTALAQGDLEAAEALLGRPYRISGRVAAGEQRGRTIGFPTANIHLHRHQSPLQGVYAVELFGLEQEPLPGVANLGRRPTVGGTRLQLEVHLFDFDREIYGRNVHVNFLRRIRDERTFESFDALRQQIDADAAQARAFFGSRE
ncbi:MAG TPA: bifunctional riboflavin kinase/FAD synthetase [Gammaproteobacteria bacterium]|nr:bifunctional riboflavin kinase/FAD synthetase [Gammaproteobacteria bacterium]